MISRFFYTMNGRGRKPYKEKEDEANEMIMMRKYLLANTKLCAHSECDSVSEWDKDRMQEY